MQTNSGVIYHRLIALWSICEAFGGGLLHAFKIPFTGLFVNSLAVICITLIGFHYRKPGAILKATFIVCIFKLTLSPHSPPTAYIAVLFQGLFGQLIFSGTRNFTARAVCLAVISLIESSVQRLLVLVFVYGNSFWEAVDEYLSRLFDRSGDYVELLAVFYIIIHALAGVFAGLYASGLALRMPGPSYSLPVRSTEVFVQTPFRKRKRIKYLFYLVWALILFIYIDSVIRPENSVLNFHRSVLIILRASAILLTWFLVLSPLLKNLLIKFMKHQESRNKELVQKVNDLLPEVLFIFKESWKASSSSTAIKRPGVFMKYVTRNILHPQTNNV